MRIITKIIFFICITFNNVSADEASNWLDSKINLILDIYKNTNSSNEARFLSIEDSINNNFAGTGIAKFVAGKSWDGSSKKIKVDYISLFKRHLALNIASMMQGYSNQEYKLVNTSYDKKNKVSLIDMEIYSGTGKLLITWRVKKFKDRFFIIDLLVADISLVKTKRSEFHSILKTINYDLEEFNILLKKQNNESYLKVIN